MYCDDLMLTTNMLGQVADNLDQWPGRTHQTKQIALAVRFVNGLVTEYTLRINRNVEPFDALGEALEAMRIDYGVASVEVNSVETQR